MPDGGGGGWCFADSCRRKPVSFGVRRFATESLLPDGRLCRDPTRTGHPEITGQRSSALARNRGRTDMTPLFGAEQNADAEARAGTSPKTQFRRHDRRMVRRGSPVRVRKRAGRHPGRADRRRRAFDSPLKAARASGQTRVTSACGRGRKVSSMTDGRRMRSARNSRGAFRRGSQAITYHSGARTRSPCGSTLRRVRRPSRSV